MNIPLIQCWNWKESFSWCDLSWPSPPLRTYEQGDPRQLRYPNASRVQARGPQPLRAQTKQVHKVLDAFKLRGARRRHRTITSSLCHSVMLSDRNLPLWQLWQSARLPGWSASGYFAPAAVFRGGAPAHSDWSLWCVLRANSICASTFKDSNLRESRFSLVGAGGACRLQPRWNATLIEVLNLKLSACKSINIHLKASCCADCCCCHEDAELFPANQHENFINDV